MLEVEYSSPVGACPASILSWEGGHGKRNGLPVSEVEADVALGRCAPSGPRSLTPVELQSLIWNDLSSSHLRLRSPSFFCKLSGIEWNESALEAAVSTVDHADIRGSAEAAVMVMIRRELPLTRLVGLATTTTAEDSPSPCQLER
jgi:hypothetical protein